MTIEEFSKTLKVSEHYILHHFKQIQQSYKRRGIILSKEGKGRSAEYGIGSIESDFINFDYRGEN